MLLFWLAYLLRNLVRFFRKPLPRDIARIDPNLACPVCGARKGRLRCVVLAGPGPQSKDLPNLNMKVMCQHTCLRCGARSFEDPVAKVDPSHVLPAVPRDELEEREDRARTLQQAK